MSADTGSHTGSDVIEPHVSLSEAAKLLGCSVSRLAHGLPRGDFDVLRPAKVLGRWRIPVAAIRQVYEDGRRTAHGRTLPRLRKVAGR